MENVTKSQDAIDINGKDLIIDLAVIDCPITNIVVYLDRAEITRNIQFPCKTVGKYSVKVRSISNGTYQDSFCVKPKDTSCDIIEVSHGVDLYSHRVIPDRNEIETLKDSISTLNDQIQSKEKLLIRIEDRKKLVHDYATRRLQSLGEHQVTVNEAKELITYHSEEMENIDLEIVQVSNQLKSLKQESKLLSEKLRNLSGDNILSPTSSLTLSIVVDVKVVGDINILFSYIVNKATWIPTYDIRVNSIESTLTLTYFAEVVQQTGEDWKDCTIVLSTSNPAIGASPPILRGKKISIISIPTRRMKSASRMLEHDDDFDRSSVTLMDDAGFQSSIGYSGNLATTSNSNTTNVLGTGDAGSTVFTINRPCTID